MVVRIFTVQAKKPNKPLAATAGLETHRERMKTDPAYRQAIEAGAKAADDLLGRRLNQRHEAEILNRGSLHRKCNV